MFNNKLAAMNKCINQSEAVGAPVPYSPAGIETFFVVFLQNIQQSKNSTDLCVTCEQPYKDLNSFYNSLVQKSKDGNICFDMVDAVSSI